MTESPFGMLFHTSPEELTYRSNANVEPGAYELTCEGDGPLRLWFMDKFYVDLPEWYTDTVIIDWAVVMASDGEELGVCRVKPTHDSQYENLLMTRKGEDQ